MMRGWMVMLLVLAGCSREKEEVATEEWKTWACTGHEEQVAKAYGDCMEQTRKTDAQSRMIEVYTSFGCEEYARRLWCVPRPAIPCQNPDSAVKLAVKQEQQQCKKLLTECKEEQVGVCDDVCEGARGAAREYERKFTAMCNIAKGMCHELHEAGSGEAWDCEAACDFFGDPKKRGKR